MRTADVCPTCSTYENALCVIFDGPLLTTLNIAPLDNLDTVLNKLETWASTVGVTLTVDEWATVSGTSGAGTLLVRLGDIATTDILIDTINDTVDIHAATVVADGTIIAPFYRLTAYTVASLPVGATEGDRAYVTDATAPTYLGSLTGGGAVKCPVFYNGTEWVSA